MDQDFEKKVRKKRIRGAVVGLIVLALCAYLIWDLNIEKADYSKSLENQIVKAQQLYDSEKQNVGNEKGQYAKYTLLAFSNQIETARAVAEDRASEYNDKKEAWEQLKDQTALFEKSANRDVISDEDAKALSEKKQQKQYDVEIKEGKEIIYTVDGKNLTQPKTINLTAKEEGPYYDQILSILSQLSLQGQTVSFYHEGDFGSELQVEAPFYSETKTEAYAYQVDLEKGKLVYTSDADVNTKAQTVKFSVSTGGDYVVLTSKLHKDGKKSVDIEEAEKEAEEQKSENTEKADGSSSEKKSENGSGQNQSSQPADQPESDTIRVTIEIRCDTLAEDLSKLENPALEAYVPSDGVILPKTEVKAQKGETVFDVLNRICRNKNIQVESSYTPAYGSYYVEGINYLYEFDGGQLSGWMYKVNGWFPNYGCSEYTLKDGDAIVWCYTCDLGKDVGGDSAI